MSSNGAEGRVTDGTARGRRLPYALCEGYVRPQERSLADKLTLAAAIAGLVRFAGEPDARGGTWAKLFAQEPAVMMAALLATRAEERRARFAELIETDARGAAAELVGFARQVEAWLERASTAGRAAFAAQLRAIDSRAAVSELVRTLARAGDADPAAVAVAVRRIAGGGDAGDAIARARAARQALVDAHEQLINVVAALRPVVERRFEARLASGEIDPALGLILAELQLLGDVEARINRFPDRHVAWYFTDVLGQAPRPAVGESVLLRFTPGQAAVPIEAGAALVARPSGSPEAQHYRLVEGLRVAPVRVADARTLRFHRDPLISPQSEMGFVSGVSLATLRTDGGGEWQRLFAPAAQTDVAMGLADLEPDAGAGRRPAADRGHARLRPPAGGRARGGAPPGDPPVAAAEEERGDALAEAVAAVVLSDPAMIEPFGLGPPEAALPVIAGWVERLVAETGMAPAPRLVQHACLRAATTPEQVQAIYGRIVAATLIEGRPLARRRLPRHAPRPRGGADRRRGGGRGGGGPDGAAARGGVPDAAAGRLRAQPELRGGPVRDRRGAGGSLCRPRPGRGSSSPSASTRRRRRSSRPPGAASPELAIRMASHARFCPLSLFEPFALETIDIAVRVEGLTRLAAFSDDGPLNTAQPFMPFGARPKDGATFLVGAPELAAKPVTRVGVTLDLGRPAAQRRRLRGALPRLWRRLPRPRARGSRRPT